MQKVYSSSWVEYGHVNSEVAGSSPTLINVSLFNPKFLIKCFTTEITMTQLAFSRSMSMDSHNNLYVLKRKQKRKQKDSVTLHLVLKLFHVQKVILI